MDDIELVTEGKLLPVQLITHRKGEPAWDPAKGELISLPQEMIKIRTVEGGRACMLYNATAKACSIYEHRPVECEALKCWDTADIEAMFLKDLLTRRALFNRSGTLMQLVEAYEKAIPVEDILFFSSASVSQEPEDRARAAEHMELVARIDSQFREQACKTLGLGKDDLLFYFGSPAADIFERVKKMQEK